MKVEVRESQIEDALVSVGSLTSGLLKLNDEPRLLVRQMLLPSGRLDLLYIHQTKLLLIELKVVKFNRKFLKQILDYKSDLTDYQKTGKLVKGDIESYLLCTEASTSEHALAKEKGVHLEKYNPQDVLNTFYQNFKPIVLFTETKPIDIGVWNLHLIHDFIYHLSNVKSIKKLQPLVGGSSRTLYNKIKFSSQLKLVNWLPNHDHISLTELGRKYVACKSEELPDRLSEKQTQVLRDFIMKNPYESSVILGIASIVESAFVLSKNCYPVPMKSLIDYFPQCSGKHFDWKTAKAKFSGTKMYSNYAVDLGLLAKTQDTIFLTPAGFRFTMQMQMHKSLKMVEAIQL